MSEPFIGQIMLVGFNFQPRGWAFCNGQILSIAQNTALFSLLGTTYGGNGQTTFALPDLRGRVPIHPGQGPGLPNVSLGEVSGSTTHTMIITEMPAHNHLLRANANNANDSLPANAYPAAAVIPTDGNKSVSAYSTATDNTTMNPGVVSPTGGSQPFSIMQPYLGLNFVIALEGIFPSRN
ncbi:MAG TPA: tail fiber protein [Pyrinomonadaceae bacterium]